jgi:hypothetical protein
MDAVPLLLRFKQLMPSPGSTPRYDENAAVSMIEEGGRLVPFVATASAANALKTMRIIGEED